MSVPILIYGDSGTGKSTAIRTLDPKTTAIVNVLGKPFPFPGSGYKTIEGKASRLLNTDDYSQIKTFINKVNASNLQTLIIDDFQYLMANEFMRKAFKTGYQKFTEIGHNAWDLLNLLTVLRDDLIIYVLTHADTNDDGTIKIKTIGRLLDDKICVEGLFSIVLYSFRGQDGYKFRTQNPGHIIAKSPIGLFPDLIDNDLNYINNRVKEFGWLETKKSMELSINSITQNLEQQTHDESTTANI
jgi:hypothetical protein